MSNILNNMKKSDLLKIISKMKKSDLIQIINVQNGGNNIIKVTKNAVRKELVFKKNKIKERSEDVMENDPKYNKIYNNK